jgi:hypothetical protein
MNTIERVYVGSPGLSARIYLRHKQSIKQTVLDSVGSAHFNRHILTKLATAPGIAHHRSSLIFEGKTVKIVVGTLAAFRFSGVLSREAEARCWWFGRLAA